MSDLDAIFRTSHGRVMASLIRALGDWQLAEDAMMDACERALTHWPTDGVPNDPVAWLLTTGRRAGIDRIRRRSTQSKHADAVAADLLLRGDERHEGPVQRDDDTLRLMFTCCHPALSQAARIALTLRVVGGLTTEEIARAFLVPVPTMAQRLVRAKKKIQGAGIPFRIPEGDERTPRLSAVLGVLYLIFNEGYAATAGDSVVRQDLCREAIRLAELLCAVAPDAEARGLLALMQFHHSRAATRTDDQGVIVLLEDQDRTLWEQNRIRTAHDLLVPALVQGPVGPYLLQACIAGCHARAPSFTATDWPQIVALYDALLRHIPSPIIGMNRAVAVGFAASWQAGLDALEPLFADLCNNHLYHAARADFLRRMARHHEAAEAYGAALDHVATEGERQFLAGCLAGVIAT